MKVRVKNFCFLLSLGIFPSHAFSVPEWVKSNATKIEGENLYTVCSGMGPSPDLARGEAIRGCKASATDMLKQSGTVRSMLYETNKEINFQQSVEDHVYFEGLKCSPLREEIEEVSQGSYRIWLRCKFDLMQAKVSAMPEKKTEEEETQNQGLKSQTSKVNMSDLKPQSVRLGEDSASSERMVINIASVPPCQTLTVRGARPRILDCKTQPAPVIISPSDDFIVIEAKGYVPRGLDLKLKKWKNHESIQVILDKL